MRPVRRSPKTPSRSPVSLQTRGARRLHVVDLDGARTGEPANAAWVRAIVAAVDVPIQVGGGVRTVERAAALFDLGVDRVIVGTTAAQNDAVIGAMLDRFAERIIVGADAIDGFVAVHGWQQHTGERAGDFAARLVARRCPAFSLHGCRPRRDAARRERRSHPSVRP